MPRSIGAILVLIRIAVVWLSIYGAGSLLSRLLSRFAWSRELLIGNVLAGLLVYLFILPALSLAGAMTRPVVATLVIVLAIPGGIGMIPELRKLHQPVGREWPLLIPLSLFTAFLCAGNMARAVRPNDHSDAQITYAVQPDRWLDAGRIYFLEETEFSAMPLVGEIVALPAASLSSGRMDQLSLLQAFQMTMLFASLIYASIKLGAGRWGVLIALAAGAACPMLAGWGALAKTDMTATLLVTIALSSGHCAASSKSILPAGACLAFGLAAATKLTVWLLFPTFLLFWSLSDYKATQFRHVALCILVLFTFPVVFAARSFIHTGTPFYLVAVPGFHPNPQWINPQVPILDGMTRRMLDPLPLELIHLFRSWNSVLVLFLTGLAAAFASRNLRRGILVALGGMVLFSAITLFALRPLAMGAKYALPVLPFAAAVGGTWISSSRWKIPGLILAVALICLVTPISPRAGFLSSFITSSSPLQFDSDTYRSPRLIQEWANEHLPTGSRLLSLFSAERYFSDFEIICARTHPGARDLFLVEGLENELEILHSLGITHVYFDKEDPMEVKLLRLNYWAPPDSAPNLAGELDILDNVGDDKALVPMKTVDGFLICRVCYQ
jgi:hypothetical protein